MRGQIDARLEQLARLRSLVASRFGDARLTVELVPSTTWYANVRSLVASADWDRIRRAVYRRAAWRCEICGGRGPSHPVECHERWRYDDAALVQRLTGFVALCPACHAVKHLGRAHVTGRGREAEEHLRAVNRWTVEQTDAYVDLVFELWSLRSRVTWRVDLDRLSRLGIRVLSDPGRQAP